MLNVLQCAQCGREAQFYCCWNTAYCDPACQGAHWPTHMQHCAQFKGGNAPPAGQPSAPGSAALESPREKDLSRKQEREKEKEPLRRSRTQMQESPCEAPVQPVVQHPQPTNPNPQSNFLRAGQFSPHSQSQGPFLAHSLKSDEQKHGSAGPPASQSWSVTFPQSQFKRFESPPNSANAKRGPTAFRPEAPIQNPVPLRAMGDGPVSRPQTFSFSVPSADSTHRQAAAATSSISGMYGGGGGPQSSVPQGGLARKPFAEGPFSASNWQQSRLNGLNGQQSRALEATSLNSSTNSLLDSSLTLGMGPMGPSGPAVLSSPMGYPFPSGFSRPQNSLPAARMPIPPPQTLLPPNSDSAGLFARFGPAGSAFKY